MAERSESREYENGVADVVGFLLGDRAIVERNVHDCVATALEKVRVQYEVAASGVTVGGGTPAHRWLDVTDTSGTPVGLKILAANEGDVDRQLRQIAEDSEEVSRDELDVARPEGWPASGLFVMP